MRGVLNAGQIRALVTGSLPLVSEWINLDQQLQPSGMDLTVREIAAYTSGGVITCDNRERSISGTRLLEFDDRNRIYLPAGVYLLTYNEIVNLPLGLMALALPRSSLLRSGAAVHTAVWDPGYCGRAQSMLSVCNPAGFTLEKNARVVQLVFFTLEETVEGYQGAYQGENIS